MNQDRSCEEQGYHEFFEQTSDGILTVHSDGSVSHVNPAACRLLGYDAEDLLGKPVDALLSHADGALLNGPASPPGSAVLAESTLVRRDGFPLPVEVISYCMPNGSRQLVVRDISHRKQTEQALRHSEEQFRVLVESIQHLVWSARADGYIEFFNQRCLDYLDTSSEQLQGWAWLQFVHEDDVPETARVWTEAFTEGKESRVQFRIRRGSDGMYRWFLAHAFPFKTLDGRIQRWFGTCTDIDDQKRTEQALRKAVCELQEKQAQLVQAGKLAMVGELATGIAHELNNPLNNIGLYVGNVLDLLRQPHLSPEERDSAIKQLHCSLEQVSRASQIITHLRCFGRASGTKREELSVNDVLLTASSFVREQCRLRQIDLVLDLAPTEPRAYFNRIQLEQVIINLLSNAWDALQKTPMKRIVLRSADCSPHVEISVQDSGTGIAPDTLPRIFDPFFTTKEFGEGTGLGLSITYGIIKEHNGDITVESRVGEGTTFVIRLPLTAAS